MSWQKCMSISKCSNLEAKYVTHFKICYQRRQKISNKQNVKSKAVEVGFTLLKINLIEKFKLKTKLTETKI